jgi:hypothetical protein
MQKQHQCIGLTPIDTQSNQLVAASTQMFHELQLGMLRPPIVVVVVEVSTHCKLQATIVRFHPSSP